MPQTIEREPLSGSDKELKIEKDFAVRPEDELNKETTENLPEGIQKMDATYKKTSFLQKAGRFLLSKFYQVGLEKSSLNDVFVKEVANPENYDLSIDEIKAKSEQKYSELYTQKSVGEIVNVDKKINEQIKILKNDDSKLVNMKYKGLKTLISDVDKWGNRLEELKASPHTSEKDKQSIESTIAEIDAMHKKLSHLEQDYLEKKKKIKPSFLDNISNAVTIVFLNSKKLNQSELLNIKKAEKELSLENEQVEKDIEEGYDLLFTQKLDKNLKEEIIKDRMYTFLNRSGK